MMEFGAVWIMEKADYIKVTVNPIYCEVNVARYAPGTKPGAACISSLISTRSTQLADT